MQQLLFLQVLTCVDTTVRESQCGSGSVDLYIAPEIALALLAHPVASAGLRGDFSDRKKCSGRMGNAFRDQQGRGET